MIKQPIVTTVSSTKDPDYFPHSGTALAVRLLADRVNWLSVVDTLFPWDRARSRIAPSVLLLMLVINVLTHRNPLYGVESWAATLPLPLLWGENIQASQFNDDALGACPKIRGSGLRQETLAFALRRCLANGKKFLRMEEFSPRIFDLSCRIRERETYDTEVLDAISNADFPQP